MKLIFENLCIFISCTVLDTPKISIDKSNPYLSQIIVFWKTKNWDYFTTNIIRGTTIIKSIY